MMRGSPNHPGKDGIKRGMIKCFGGDAEEVYVLLVELAVVFGVLAEVMSEELMYLIAKPHGGYRPITCQSELQKAVDRIQAHRVEMAYEGVERIPPGQVCEERR